MAPDLAPREFLAALGLPRDARLEPAAGGASGDAWRVDAPGATYLLRRSAPGRLTQTRLAAMAAARAAGLPAPELLARAGGAILLSWLPGIPMTEAVAGAPASAEHWGLRAGELQRRLHAIAVPASMTTVPTDAGLPFRAGRDVVGLPAGDALLHLDWHPGNLLVDDERSDICGIVDWDNARRGHPWLDLARTEAVLTLEPALATLPTALHAAVPAFLAAWRRGYGRAAHAIPDACRQWAARVMLADLEPRHVRTPQALDPLRKIAFG